MTEPVTVAQEAVTNAILCALIACGALSLTITRWFELSDPLSYVILAMTSFVIAAYIVPNVVAFWLGRPLHDIMSDGERGAPSRTRT